jgi:hypothetical protein
MPLHRLLLVLQRSPQQEAALRKLLDDQQTKASPNYHMWLTPEQFGEQFGPAPSDIQAVTDWLASEGFEVSRVTAGRTVIEFSGTAGALRNAFHTEMHKFAVNGEERWANSSDPQIPAALAPVVAGFASLNNFPRRPLVQRLGAFSRAKGSAQARPLFTITGSNNQTFYAVGATDLATIYNILPLWQASPAIDGTGQTIAIVGQTNINIQDPHGFREVFFLPINDPTVILDGPDPGITADETEADLDVEWSGAVATGATIDLVVSETTETTAGIDLSSLYIIDSNLAPVMSESYGYCEEFLGTGGNAFYSTTREQGAAQGITIINSAGDSGSARCDQSSEEVAAQYGLAVSGLASTPFDTAVGGTDFNDATDFSTYWAATNNSDTFVSALSYIPEMTWNDSCARTGSASACASVATDTPQGVDHTAGGGGQSSCVTSTVSGTTITCTAGYPKPAWQTGSGVPADGVRDIPDVSLFASDGFNHSFYVLCEADALPSGYASCAPNDPSWYFLAAGGTSVAAPAFAGIMALVNQKTGERQGNANYVLYPLAAKSGASCPSNDTMASTANRSSCVFYDVVTGNNSVACLGGSPNCSASTAGTHGILVVNPPSNPAPAWTTNPGYDLATGLGSMNVTNLVKNWSSVSFAPTTTTLANLSPTTVTHGQPVNFTVQVAPQSGTAIPTGDASLIAQTGNSTSQATGIGAFKLSDGAFSGSTNMLPGGTYGVTAHYAGNGTLGASDSTPPITVTVNPENSQTHLAVVTFNPVTGSVTSANATSVVYGSSPYVLRADVTNSSGQDCSTASYGCPTGQVTLTNQAPLINSGYPISLGAYTLNSQGFTEDQSFQLSPGLNSLSATYSGDNSYNSGAVGTDGVTLVPAPTTTTLVSLPSSSSNPSVPVTVTLNTQSYGAGPTGTVQILSNGVPVSYLGVFGTAYVASTGAFATGQASGNVTLPAGSDSITAQYEGDNNYASSTSAATVINVTDFSVSTNASTITVPAPGQSGSATFTLASLNGFAGVVTLSCTADGNGTGCAFSPSSVTLSGSSSATVTLTTTTTAPVNASSDARRQKPRRGAVAPRLSFRGPSSGGALLAIPFCLRCSWLWAFLLALATWVSWGKKRRRLAGLFVPAALLLVGLWVACGGGGGGGGGSPTPLPVAQVSPASLTFGQQPVGTASAASAVTLSNTGDAALSIYGVALGGSNAGDFAETNSCGSSLAAGANCLINVTFTPTAAGTRNASLAISDNASGSPQTVSLSGAGASASASLTPASLAFGQENQGSTTAAQIVTVSNTGGSLLNLWGIAIGGTNPADFAQTNNCPSSLAGGVTCTISVTFTPTATGTRGATLAVIDNTGGSPQTVGLNGTGLLPVTQPGGYWISYQATSGTDTHAGNILVNVQ